MGAEVQEVVKLEWNDTSWWGRAYWFVVAAALSGSRRGACHMVGISSYKYLLLAGTNKNAFAPVWASAVWGICRPVLGV